MRWHYYLLFYIKIIVILCFLFNNLFLLISIFVVKSVFYVNYESDTEYEFFYLNLDHDKFDAKYLEVDIDDQFIYVLSNQENYLFFNCRFFFDFYGGSDNLDFLDFIDFDIYKFNDLRNYKNIYNFLEFKNVYEGEEVYKLNDLVIQMYNDSYYSNLLTKDVNVKQASYFSNIVYKSEFKNKIKYKQKIYLYKKYE